MKSRNVLYLSLWSSGGTRQKYMCDCGPVGPRRKFSLSGDAHQIVLGKINSVLTNVTAIKFLSF